MNNLNVFWTVWKQSIAYPNQTLHSVLSVISGLTSCYWYIHHQNNIAHNSTQVNERFIVISILVFIDASFLDQDLLRCWYAFSYQGHWGNRCEISNSNCDSQPCYNGGECIPTETSFECLCPRGSAGLNCEYDTVDECLSNPCLNGGTCYNKVGKLRVEREHASTFSMQVD